MQMLVGIELFSAPKQNDFQFTNRETEAQIRSVANPGSVSNP